MFVTSTRPQHIPRNYCPQSRCPLSPSSENPMSTYDLSTSCLVLPGSINARHPGGAPGHGPRVWSQSRPTAGGVRVKEPYVAACKITSVPIKQALRRGAPRTAPWPWCQGTLPELCVAKAFLGAMRFIHPTEAFGADRHPRAVPGSNEVSMFVITRHAAARRVVQDDTGTTSCSAEIAKAHDLRP